MPVLNATEVKYGIPTDLLARLAYEESRFRADIISGAVKSFAGAVGIIQLLPEYFYGAGIDPTRDIDIAGKYLSKLDSQFHDWQVALAAYNWGPGNVDKCMRQDRLLSSMPLETQPTASIQFHTPPGIGWRLHMSKIAAEIRTVSPVRERRSGLHVRGDASGGGRGRQQAIGAGGSIRKNRGSQPCARPHRLPLAYCRSSREGTGVPLKFI